MLGGSDLLSSGPLRLANREDQEGLRQALREQANHVVGRLEVSSLANLDHTNVIRAALNDGAIARLSELVGLGSGRGGDGEDNLGGCCTALHDGLGEGLQGLQIP